jgi:hypothetical protein
MANVWKCSSHLGRSWYWTFWVIGTKCRAACPGDRTSNRVLSFSRIHSKISVCLINGSEHHSQVWYMLFPRFKEAPEKLFHLLSGRWYKVKKFVFHIKGYIQYDSLFHILHDIDHRRNRLVTKAVSWLLKFVWNLPPVIWLMYLSKTSRILRSFSLSNDQMMVECHD